MAAISCLFSSVLPVKFHHNFFILLFCLYFTSRTFLLHVLSAPADAQVDYDEIAHVSSTEYIPFFSPSYSSPLHLSTVPFPPLQYTDLASPAEQSSFRTYDNTSPRLATAPSSVSTTLSENEFDYLVIGGGSGGIATAFRAASYGAKVAIIEKDNIGGACVNVGCIPKKVMYNAASVGECLRNARNYNMFDFNDEDFQQNNWERLKKIRDEYIERLQGSYQRRIEKSNITLIRGVASFVDKNTVKVKSKRKEKNSEEQEDTKNEEQEEKEKNKDNEGYKIGFYKAEHIVIATGSRPVEPRFPGAEHCIDNRMFFSLERRPRNAAVIGGGYIGVEFSSILASLDVNTTFIIREERILTNFDETMAKLLQKELQRNKNMNIINNANVVEVMEEESAGGKTKAIRLASGDLLKNFDVVVAAIGRYPDVEELDLDRIGVSRTSRQVVLTDGYYNTNVANIYAVGDVTAFMPLTPVAIAAARALADRVFGGKRDARLNYNFLATVIFSHPPLGVIGLSERQAKDKYGEENVKTYLNTFINTFHAVWQIPHDEKPSTTVKVICKGDEEEVVGIYILGMNADEMVQGFAAAVKMGITKKDFDETIAVHPTVSEEVVRLY